MFDVCYTCYMLHVFEHLRLLIFFSFTICIVVINYKLINGEIMKKPCKNRHYYKKQKKTYEYFYISFSM